MGKQLQKEITTRYFNMQEERKGIYKGLQIRQILVSSVKTLELKEKMGIVKAGCPEAK